MKHLLILLIMIFPSVNAEEFYKNITKEDLPSWQKVRVEGSHKYYLYNPLNIAMYGIKSMKKKYTTSPELKDYFSLIQNEFQMNDKPRGEKVASLSLAGDIMWLRKDWSNFLAPSLKTFFHQKDFFFANLETLISKSNPVPSFLPARATFNSKPSLINEFDDQNGQSPFSALSVANNHSLDYGDNGMIETIEFLNEKGIPFSGVLLSPNKEKRYTVVEKNGIKIGFYAATYGMNKGMENDTQLDFNLIKDVTSESFDNTDLFEIKTVLNEMKQEKVDLKIISLHWGHEYEYYPKANQIHIAREIVSLGADILLGHHSHSQQPLDICYVNKYKETNDSRICQLSDDSQRKRKALIIYSTGNFITNMYEFLNEIGLIVTIDLYRNSLGQIDWFSPELDLIINHKKHPKTGKRQTLFLKDYLKKKCFRKKGCEKEDIEKVKFLKTLYSKDILNL